MYKQPDRLRRLRKRLLRLFHRHQLRQDQYMSANMY